MEMDEDTLVDYDDDDTEKVKSAAEKSRVGEKAADGSGVASTAAVQAAEAVGLRVVAVVPRADSRRPLASSRVVVASGSSLSVSSSASASSSPAAEMAERARPLPHVVLRSAKAAASVSPIAAAGSTEEKKVKKSKNEVVVSERGVGGGDGRAGTAVEDQESASAENPGPAASSAEAKSREPELDRDSSERGRPSPTIPAAPQASAASVEPGAAGGPPQLAAREPRHGPAPRSVEQWREWSQDKRRYTYRRISSRLRGFVKRCFTVHGGHAARTGTAASGVSEEESSRADVVMAIGLGCAYLEVLWSCFPAPAWAKPPTEGVLVTEAGQCAEGILPMGRYLRPGPPLALWCGVFAGRGQYQAAVKAMETADGVRELRSRCWAVAETEWAAYCSDLRRAAAVLAEKAMATLRPGVPDDFVRGLDLFDPHRRDGPPPAELETIKLTEELHGYAQEHAAKCYVLWCHDRLVHEGADAALSGDLSRYLPQTVLDGRTQWYASKWVAKARASQRREVIAEAAAVVQAEAIHPAAPRSALTPTARAVRALAAPASGAATASLSVSVAAEASGPLPRGENFTRNAKRRRSLRRQRAKARADVQASQQAVEELKKEVKDLAHKTRRLEGEVKKAGERSDGSRSGSESDRDGGSQRQYSPTSPGYSPTYEDPHPTSPSYSPSSPKAT